MESNLLGPISAFCSAFVWAIGSAGYSRLAKDNSAFAINFTRALVALPMFIVAAFIVSGGWLEGLLNYRNLQMSQVGWLSLSMLASYGLGDVLFLWSVHSLGLPGALAIASCFPVWTVLFGYLFSNETVLNIQFLGLFVTIVGVIFIVLNGPHADKNASIKVLPASHVNDFYLPVNQPTLIGKPATKEKSRFSFKGLLLAFGASVCWAMNSFATARGGVGVNPHVGNTIRMSAALILTAGFGRILMPKKSIFLPKKQLLGSLWLFCFEAFGGGFFYFYGMAHSSLVLGSTLASLAPAISVPVALLWGFEKFSLIRTFGVGIVVLGIFLLVGTT